VNSDHDTHEIAVLVSECRLTVAQNYQLQVNQN